MCSLLVFVIRYWLFHLFLDTTMYSCIIAAAYIIDNDEAREIDDWLHHQQ